MTQPRIIEHAKYAGTNATINLKHFAADECGRQAVNALWLWENPDAVGYIYDEEKHEMGLDPWRSIVGVDAKTDGSKIILETGRVGEMEVDPDFEVYVQRTSMHKWEHELKD